MNSNNTKVVGGLMALLFIVSLVNTQAILKVANASKPEQTAAVGKTVSKTSFIRGENSPTIKKVQEALTKLGFYKGAINGTFGNQTETAVRNYQRANKLSVTGQLDTETINSILGLGKPRGGGETELHLKVFLDGPYNPETGLMSTALNDLNLIPMNEPYTDLGYELITDTGEDTISNPAVLDVIGSNAIIDWVVVETRWGQNAAQVFDAQTALLQADGDIVAVDGVSPIIVPFQSGIYFISVKHRNHLGVMTATAVDVSQTIDFSTTPLYGTNPAKTVGNVKVLWAGDVSADGLVQYTGQGNDRDFILYDVGEGTPTNVLTNVYSRSDVNMDGQVKYVGTNNDRDPILVNIGGSTPTNILEAQLPEMQNILVSMLSSSSVIEFEASAPGQRDVGHFQLKFKVTALNNDVFIPSTFELENGNNVTGQGLAYGIAEGSVFSQNSVLTCTNSCTSVAGGFRIDEGDTSTFALDTIVQPAADGSFALYLNSINWGNSPGNVANKFYPFGLGQGSIYQTPNLNLNVF